MIERAELSEVENAFVSMVQEEHAALIHQADKVRDGRMAVLLRSKNIPDDGRLVSVERTEDGKAALVFEGDTPTKD